MSMLKSAPAIAAAAALSLNAAAEQKTDWTAGMTPPTQPGHVEYVQKPILLAQATTQPAFNINTIPAGALTPAQEQEFSTAMARIHNAHVDNYIQKYRADKLAEIKHAADTGGNVVKIVNDIHFDSKASKKNFDEQSRSPEFLAGKQKEADFIAKFGAAHTKREQYDLVIPYLRDLDAATACLDRDNQKAITEGAPRIMKPDQVKKLAEGLTNLADFQRSVYDPAPKAQHPKH